MLGVIERDVRREALAELSRFRGEFYACLTVRGDSLFELAEALLCVEGSVKTLVGLALAPEHRRGHGALYAGLNQGRLDVGRLRRAPAGLPLPRAADGRLVLAVDVSPWLRPDAATPPDRSFCHTYGRGEQKQQMIPGWPYSVIAALETGRTSWTGVLDTQRLEPGADVAAVTTVQVREPVDRLIAAGQWHEGGPLIWVVVDAGYDVPRLAHLLRDLPVEVLGRLRSDRVMRPAGTATLARHQRPTSEARRRVRLQGPGHLGRHHRHYHDGDHPLRHCRGEGVGQTAPAADPAGGLGGLGGRFADHRRHRHPPAGRAPAERWEPKPLWLWRSRTGATTADVELAWQAFLRRFDIEHNFRFDPRPAGTLTPRSDPSACRLWSDDPSDHKRQE